MFGERLKQLRTEFKMTQSDLGKLLSVSPSAIGMYEAGKRDPDTTTVKILSEIFSVSADYLLGISDLRIDPSINSDININVAELDEEDIELVKAIVERLKGKQKK